MYNIRSPDRENNDSPLAHTFPFGINSVFLRIHILLLSPPSATFLYFKNLQISMSLPRLSS
jgi:hypothetical protein